MQLRYCYNTFTNLYESGEDVSYILNNTAPLFFQDLNHILIERYYLLVRKLTDPKKSRGRANLTIANINASLEQEGLFTRKIEQLSKRLMKYRATVKTACDRLIAHSDKSSIINELILGEHDEDELIAFFRCLQEYCDEIGHTVGEGPLDFSTQVGPGDAIDLIRALERGMKKGGCAC